MRLETAIEQRACLLAKKLLGLINLKIKQSGDDGYADRLFLLPEGRPVFMEFKRPGEKLRPLQKKRAATLGNLGYNVTCVDNEVEAIEYLARSLEATQLSEGQREILAEVFQWCADSRPWDGEDGSNT